MTRQRDRYNLMGVFELHYLENRGAAFGILQGQKGVFLVCTVLILFLIAFFYIRMPEGKRFFLMRTVAVLLAAYRPQDAVRFGALLWAAVSVAGLIGWPVYAGFFAPWGVGYPGWHIECAAVSSIAIFVAGAVACSGKDAAERERILVLCTLLAVNAAVLGVPLGNAAAAETATLASAVGTSVGAGLGAFIAVVLFATVRQRIDERPAHLAGDRLAHVHGVHLRGRHRRRPVRVRGYGSWIPSSSSASRRSCSRSPCSCSPSRSPSPWGS